MKRHDIALKLNQSIKICKNDNCKKKNEHMNSNEKQKEKQTRLHIGYHALM